MQPLPSMSIWKEWTKIIRTLNSIILSCNSTRATRSLVAKLCQIVMKSGPIWNHCANPPWKQVGICAFKNIRTEPKPAQTLCSAFLHSKTDCFPSSCLPTKQLFGWTDGCFKRRQLFHHFWLPLHESCGGNTKGKSWWQFTVVNLQKLVKLLNYKNDFLNNGEKVLPALSLVTFILYLYYGERENQSKVNFVDIEPFQHLLCLRDKPVSRYVRMCYKINKEQILVWLNILTSILTAPYWLLGYLFFKSSINRTTNGHCII